MSTDQINQDDKDFWFKEMSLWRDRGDTNVYEFPGIIRALCFGGMSKCDARALFSEWCTLKA